MFSTQKYTYISQKYTIQKIVARANAGTTCPLDIIHINGRAKIYFSCFDQKAIPRKVSLFARGEFNKGAISIGQLTDAALEIEIISFSSFAPILSQRLPPQLL